ncbi:8-oxo-dGTP pyrophosphatase MutT, NUDIX family [Pedococcus dokdonensis]|uniref:8-oxo-dGTP pyrophosphatase MutT, NUDIX family n=1 Tax=Pedococcus dokdonensis TaxID=443156 RepID=A0A1H0MVL4_9MICO|nr:NUDIX domain-containing protein [Pedococcus dokdonensis]SDO84336.1 8-oxo-dGTP pyrophosphatase MutT, NUDIX family [Pedococcus dokdonensis]
MSDEETVDERTLDEPVLHRRAARVVVVDPDGLVLMIEGFDPHHPEQPYWYTVGGGLEAGESERDAAVREVWEETGRTISVDDLVGPVHHDEGSFSFEGRRIVQQQVFYGLATERFDAEPGDLAELEVRSTLRIAWVDPGARRAAGEAVYPLTLEDLVRAVQEAAATRS